MCLKPIAINGTNKQTVILSFYLCVLCSSEHRQVILTKARISNVGKGHVNLKDLCCVIGWTWFVCVWFLLDVLQCEIAASNTDAPYHGGSEGNVVNEGRRQSRHPHHQDDGYGQALVFWHRLRWEVIRVIQVHVPTSDHHRLSQTHRLC